MQQGRSLNNERSPRWRGRFDEKLERLRLRIITSDPKFVEDAGKALVIEQGSVASQ